MACCYSTCNVKSKSDTEEKKIHCSWCDAFAHSTCSGINLRSFNIITDPTNGLNWSCPKCRAHNADLFKFVRQVKEGMRVIGKDLLELMDKFQSLDTLFNSPNFVVNTVSLNGNLHTVNQPPPKSRCNKESVNRPLLRSVVNVKEQPKTTDSMPVIVINDGDGTKTSSSVVESNDTSVDEVNSNTVIGLQTSTESKPITKSRANVSPSLITTVSDVTRLSDEKVVNSAKSLRIIPSRKSIFITRFANETTVDDLQSYITTNCSDIVDTELNIFKLISSRPREICSFKITVSAKWYEKLLKKSFWPEGVFIRPFVPRNKTQTANTPSIINVSSDINSSKN